MPMRETEQRDGRYLEGNKAGFNASFIVGGQIGGEPMRLFRIYAEGNFIEAGTDTLFFQTGETKYGKPILDRVLTPDHAAWRTPRSVCWCRSIRPCAATCRWACRSTWCPMNATASRCRRRRRLDEGDPYFTAVSLAWGEGIRQVFSRLPELRW